MNKKVLRLFAVLCMLSLLCACSLVRVNEDRDRAQVVATVGGESILKGEVLDLFWMMAAYSGLSDLSSADAQSLISQVLEYMIQEKVQAQKAAELGVALTQDEKAEILAEVQTMYDEAHTQYKDNYIAQDETLSEEEAGKKATDYLAEMGYTLESLVADQELGKLIEKLRENVTRDITVEEDAVQARYSSLMNEQTTGYDANPGAFADDYLSGDAYVYIPVDYVRVKHILIAFTEEEKAELIEYASKAIGSDNRVQDEDAYANFVERAEEIMREGGYDVTAEAVLAQIAEGADFDELIAAYGEDPGMQSDPYMTQGYLVWEDETDYAFPFHEASMALTEDGQVSGITLTTFGIHIIKRVGHISAGGRNYSDVQDDLRALTLTEAQSAAYNELLTDWTENATIKRYSNRLTS